MLLYGVAWLAAWVSLVALAYVGALLLFSLPKVVRCCCCCCRSRCPRCLMLLLWSLLCSLLLLLLLRIPLPQVYELYKDQIDGFLDRLRTQVGGGGGWGG